MCLDINIWEIKKESTLPQAILLPLSEMEHTTSLAKTITISLQEQNCIHTTVTPTLYDTKVKASHMPFQMTQGNCICSVCPNFSTNENIKVSLYIHHSSRRTLSTTEHLLQLNDGTEYVSTATNKTKEALRLLAGILCGSANGKCMCFPLKHTRGFGVALKLVIAVC